MAGVFRFEITILGVCLVFVIYFCGFLVESVICESLVELLLF